MSDTIALPAPAAASGSSALSILNAHFAARERAKIEVTGLPFPLFFAPLNGEQAVKLGLAAQDKNPKTKSRGFAELIVEMVTIEDGAQAFPLVKGGLDPVKTLTTGVDPKVFTTLCNALLDSTSHTAASELEKK